LTDTGAAFVAEEYGVKYTTMPVLQKPSAATAHPPLQVVVHTANRAAVVRPMIAMRTGRLHKINKYRQFVITALS
jgi:hypothetical protein